MIRVLIAEDQQLFRELLEHMLKNSEEISVVACASNGREAIALAKVYQPEVILMDLQMPECDGIEATKQIKEQTKSAKILILTASHDEFDVAEALRSGADGYILKSISKEEMILAIKSVYVGMEVIHREVRQQAHSAYSGSATTAKNGRIVVAEGIETELSAREIEIIKMLVAGKETAEIARELYLAEGRLRNIITEILSKLMLKNRMQLAVFAIKHRLVE